MKSQKFSFIKSFIVGTAIIATSVAQADLLFLLSAAEKKNALESGLVEESLFSYPHPEVLVIGKDTTHDIKLVAEDGLIEVRKSCYVGSAQDAVETIKKLILNTNKRPAIATEVKSSKIEDDGRAVVGYTILDQEDQLTDKTFEIEACEKSKSETVPMDPIVGRFAMCSEAVVRLPDTIYAGLEEIAQLSASNEERLSRLQGLFAELNADQSEGSYCSVMTEVAGKTKKDHVERCERALVSDDVVNLQLLDVLKYKKSQEEVLCALSSMISFLTFGF